MGKAALGLLSSCGGSSCALGQCQPTTRGERGLCVGGGGGEGHLSAVSTRNHSLVGDDRPGALMCG